MRGRMNMRIEVMEKEVVEMSNLIDLWNFWILKGSNV